MTESILHEQPSGSETPKQTMPEAVTWATGLLEDFAQKNEQLQALQQAIGGMTDDVAKAEYIVAMYSEFSQKINAVLDQSVSDFGMNDTPDDTTEQAEYTTVASEVLPLPGDDWFTSALGSTSVKAVKLFTKMGMNHG